MSILKMAWRNLWRNRRRTLVTVAAMSLALLAMITYSGLVEGYLGIMERNILDMEMGDVQIFAHGYREKPSLYERIDNPDGAVKVLEGAGLRASPRVLASGLAALGDASAGVSFRGVDPRRDSLVTKVHQQLSKGTWLDRKDPKGVVLGRRLARTLGAKIGSEMVVLTQGADGSMANELYRVRGVLKPIGDVVDRTGVYILDDALRELLVMPKGAHQIMVRRPPEMPLSVAKAKAEGALSGLEVKSWRDLIPTLASMLDSTRGMIYIMFSIVYIVIAILILNAMLMAVFERIREFGVLKALGMSPGTVMRLVLAESAMQTGIAMTVGTLASLPLLWYLSTVGIHMESLGGGAVAGIAIDPHWRAVIGPNTFVGPLVTLGVIATGAVFYPAVKAALIRPIQAMQHR